MTKPRSIVRSCFLIAFSLSATHAVAAGPDKPMFDLSKEKVLYCVGYAHLDTQWRWDFTTTIDKFIKNTLDENFDRFETYPQYVFNFTGSARYKMMKEYYPKRYERLKHYIAAGRWFVSGSSVDEGDVNVPSAEATIRQVLYGNEFFREEFGKESLDYMLPDCFGFPASMPSIWAHCGLKGFSTQKLTWGSAVGIPFKIGVWEGPDGNSVIAAFDPGSYSTAIQGRVDTNPQWVKRVNDNGRKYGVWADYHYYGVGDEGGAPRAEDVANYIASIDNPDSQIHVALVSSDQMYKDITPEERKRLPRYRGDLLLTEHSAGTLTSEAYMKRWNRKNEILADAAERVAVLADWLGNAVYPIGKLNASWERLLANQMHDILPGTSIPRAYTYSWNDEIVASNGFSAVLQDSVGAVATDMDTQVRGVPLVVYNALTIGREDPVEATIAYAGSPPAHVQVYDPEGHELVTQILHRDDHSVTVLFAAKVPPLSLTVFDVRAAEAEDPADAALSVSNHGLENEYYAVRINDDGDVASVFDKKQRRELLQRPAKLVFTHEKPRNWPAWNMDWADRKHAPIDAVKGPAKVRIVEHGPVRVALEIERKARDSIVTQQIRLARGSAGRRVEFKTHIDWQSTEVALKASFPLTASNPKATYNWGMGTIDRGNNEPTKYEVPSHEWFDLTDTSGDFGVSVLDDCKFGSDKPSDNEVRLTLLYTPGVHHSYMDQHSQDWGRHDMTYALYAHKGDWREGRSEWQGRRLNQPLKSFQVLPHDGHLGQSISLATLNTQQVAIRAIKRAEADGNVIIVRLQEFWGKPADDVRLTFLSNIADAYEVDGQERRIGPATFTDRVLQTSLTSYSPKSFAIRLAPPIGSQGHLVKSVAVTLPFNVDVVSEDADRTDGAMDAAGRTLPAEQLPPTITSEGITFTLGKTTPGALNAVACQGQEIPLPAGEFDKVYLLAAATDDGTPAKFRVGDNYVNLDVQSWTGFVGQWDDRVWDHPFGEVDHVCDGKVVGIKPGYIKPSTIAWFATHRHHPTLGNEAYRFSYLFKYGIDLPRGARTIALPNSDGIKVLAITVAAGTHDRLRPAAPLFDDFTNRPPVALRHVYPPPPPPVYEGADAVGAVTIDRQSSFESLSMGAPSDHDYVDQHTGRGIVFRFSDGNGDYRPHRASGAVGDTFPRLNDGEVARHDDDTDRCVWYDNAGRFYVDLGASIPVDRVNTYSWHRDNRAPQKFSLWGSNAATMPDPNITKDHRDGWTLLGVVDTKPLGDGGKHGSSVHARQSGKPLGTYRYLLWAAEDMGQGTFFTEIDVYAGK